MRIIENSSTEPNDINSFIIQHALVASLSSIRQDDEYLKIVVYIYFKMNS